MGEADATSRAAVGELEMIPLSALNHYLYCPRRAALIHIEGIFEQNEHTVRGNIVHEHADLPGYEVAEGVTVLRALPVWSDRLGLSGKCDVVEAGERKAESRKQKAEPPYVGSYASLVPVEYKKGKRRVFENDDAQVCAQGLCLEEMFGVTVERGAVFHAASKRRREVEFTAELRKLTEDAIAELHRLAASGSVPAAVFKPACEECSLYEICLPRVTCGTGGAARAASRLFEI
ncbi:MAG: CRISPR-associated protein Cas4 [Verrucomicrobia bacterium]|nr:CRISPR-associated protein Cas4 [Verrucomicrobiota bacterium]